MKKHIKILKRKLKIFDPKLKEECGVFGISNAKDASALTALGLHALQHRGQDSTGVVTSDKVNFFAHRGMGQVSEVFSDKKVFSHLKGDLSIGHNRYGTTGESALKNVQPLFSELNIGGLAIAHNGNITNALTLRNQLVQDGAIFQSTSDTETILQLVARSRKESRVSRFADALRHVEGAFALVALTSDKLIGVRDPFGIRPLVLGKHGDSFILSSETCALDIIGAEFVREIENGEIVVISNEGVQSIKPFNII